MKKTSKPATKKPAAKKPAAKKTSSKPRRKTAGQGELAQVVERLTLIADRLGEAVDRLEQSALVRPATQPLPPREPALETHQPVDEHADDFELPGTIREE
jgi:hypothetical protein